MILHRFLSKLPPIISKQHQSQCMYRASRVFSTNLILSKEAKTPNLIQNEKELLISQIQQQIDKLTEIQAQLLCEHDERKDVLVAKNPRGTRDYHPHQTALRKEILNKIVNIFKLHGAVEIDTPVFELKEILTSKYGEETKKIYDLKEFNGEALSLRYDLTVPLARYLAQHGITNLKCFHIGKVYRRDDAAVSLGRFREFYQCDFDIAGQYDPLLPDVECIKILSETLEELEFGQFVIRVNHRSLLSGILKSCGAYECSLKAICTSIDKLDKFSWSEIRKELTEKKGIENSVVEKIGQYLQLNGMNDLIEKLSNDESINNDPQIIQGINDLKLLLKYCDILGLTKSILIDLSLARGLDYYTGVIFEAVLKDEFIRKGSHGNRFGSIASGGRYDNLVGTFNTNKPTPCVGISIGVERIFSIFESRKSLESDNICRADVFVCSAHKGLYEKRLKLVNNLWNAGIQTEHSYRLNPKLLSQFQYCEKHKIPLAVVMGDSELSRNVVKLRNVDSREEKEVSIVSLANEIQNSLRNV